MTKNILYSMMLPFGKQASVFIFVIADWFESNLICDSGVSSPSSYYPWSF